MDNTTKKPYQSVTLWSNLILAAAAFFPAVKEHVTPDILGSIFLVVNTLLRFKTNTGVTWKF